MDAVAHPCDMTYCSAYCTPTTIRDQKPIVLFFSSITGINYCPNNCSTIIDLLRICAIRIMPKIIG